MHTVIELNSSTLHLAIASMYLVFVHHVIQRMFVSSEFSSHCPFFFSYFPFYFVLKYAPNTAKFCLRSNNIDNRQVISHSVKTTSVKIDDAFNVAKIKKETKKNNKELKLKKEKNILKQNENGNLKIINGPYVTVSIADSKNFVDLNE